VPVTDCPSACAAIYACGLENDAMGDPLCPNFDGTPAQTAQFTMACESTCTMQPVLINLVDPSNCEQTITTLTGVSAEFDVICGDAPPPPMGCALLCGQLYDCGVENDNCPGFTGDPAERDAFVMQCIPDCTPVESTLAAVIDPANCSQTVSTISNVSPNFANACQNGVP
jgi:hypothetical protein